MENAREKTAAVVLAAGKGKRMNSDIPKPVSYTHLPMQVNTIEVAMGSIEETMSTSGTVSSEQSKTYYAPVGATISEMKIALGDEVAEGQQLVSFDTTELENRKAKAALDAVSYTHLVRKPTEHIAPFLKIMHNFIQHKRFALPSFLADVAVRHPQKHPQYLLRVGILPES